jgi:hypothetical protein
MSVSYLNEYAQVNKLSAPVYHYEKIGQDHNPLFLCTISLENMTVTGEGSKKSKAKEQAATNFVKQMFLTKHPVEVPQTSTSTSTTWDFTDPSTPSQCIIFLDAENRANFINPLVKMLDANSFKLQLYYSDSWPAKAMAEKACAQSGHVFSHTVDSDVNSASDMLLFYELMKMAPQHRAIVISNDKIFLAISEVLRCIESDFENRYSFTSVMPSSDDLWV